MEWTIIENKYGQLISYNTNRFNNMYRDLSYQGYIVKMLESREYDIFLDVGAYVGFFSKIAVHTCKYVFAYEAHPIFYGMLLYNMRFHENIICKYAFVSKKGDIPKISNSHPFIFIDTNKENVKYNIDVITLDDEYETIKNNFLDDKMLVKIDVEGHELKILEASNKLIKDNNIDWIIDVHIEYGISLNEVKKYFENREITQIGRKVLKIK